MVLPAIVPQNPRSSHLAKLRQRMQGNAHASTMPVGNCYGAMRVTFLSLACNRGVSDKLRQV
jgi:hypothetical protein